MSSRAPYRWVRSPGRAQWFPVVTVVICTVASPHLVGAGLSWLQVAGVDFFLGLAGGASWQALDRSDVVARLTGQVCVWIFIMALALLPSAYLTSEGLGGVALPGIAAGVLIAEGWLRRRSRAVFEDCESPHTEGSITQRR